MIAIMEAVQHDVPDPPGNVARVLFQQTIRRQFVHRASISEVFVTDVRTNGDDLYLVGAQWPRCHSFFGPRLDSVHDPMLFVETIRQAGLAIAHQAMGVPLNHHFISHQKTYRISRAGLSVEHRPIDVLLRVTLSGGRGAALVNKKMTFDCVRDGELIATAEITWSCVSDASYARLRGKQGAAAIANNPQPLPDPVQPQLVGRTRDIDVVIAPTAIEGAWTLRADRRHPVMFEHTVDHVPGMVVMEAARQAALVVTGRPCALPLAGQFTFNRYIELDEPCVILASQQRNVPGSRANLIEVSAVQAGHTVAAAEIQLAADE